MKVATLIFALTLLFVPTATGKDKPSNKCPEAIVAVNACDLSAEEFEARANTAPTMTFSMREVSAQEALGAASRPGADTEVAAGQTPEQATGATTGADVAITQEVEDDGGGPGGAYKLCSFGTLSAQWGTWPMQQIVNDNTYWCWSTPSLNITYRSTTVTTSTAVCSGDSPYSFRYAGGLGVPYVYIEAGAYFHCQTPYPWISVNVHRCLHDVWYPWGAGTRGTDCF